MPTIKDRGSLLLERDIAERLKVSVSSVRKWRRTGKGPNFLRFGKVVRYDARDVQRWLVDKRQESITNTPMPTL